MKRREKHAAGPLAGVEQKMKVSSRDADLPRLRHFTCPGSQLKRVDCCCCVMHTTQAAGAHNSPAVAGDVPRASTVVATGRRAVSGEVTILAAGVTRALFVLLRHCPARGPGGFGVPPPEPSWRQSECLASSPAVDLSC